MDTVAMETAARETLVLETVAMEIVAMGTIAMSLLPSPVTGLLLRIVRETIVMYFQRRSLLRLSGLIMLVWEPFL